MNVHVILNLLNHFGKREHLRGYAEHLYNPTTCKYHVRCSDSIYHNYDTKSTLKSRFLCVQS